MIPLAKIEGPHIDFAGLSPLLAIGGGAIVVLMVGLFRKREVREEVVPFLAAVSLLAALGLTIWQWGENKEIISGALAVDELAMGLNTILIVAGLATVVLSLRGDSARTAGEGEYYALLLSSIGGMFVLVAAQNLVTLFLGLELLSIPLYVLCASDMRRATSLESGLKYLIVGSVGSATFLYGLAMVYGATGATDFDEIAAALRASGDLATDPLLLTGLGLSIVGLAFKASVAPFHTWTPDVYEGAPTPVTAFMAVATKAAAIGVTIRFLEVALVDAQADWAPLLAALAIVTIIVGNVGALAQSSLKRMLAYSSVAQAGYMLAGVIAGTQLGVKAVVFYLAVYLLMNLAAFAVVISRERATDLGDDIEGLAGLGATNPWLAWPMTIAMLSLAGLPATAGFVGKITLIDAAVSADYTWVAIFIVIGSMISLGYYLRVVATMWMRDAPEAAAAAVAGVAGRPAIAGGSPELDAARRGHWELTAVAVVFAAASVAFGILPSVLLDAARDASEALAGLL